MDDEEKLHLIERNFIMYKNDNTICMKRLFLDQIALVDSESSFHIQTYDLLLLDGK